MLHLRRQRWTGAGSAVRLRLNSATVAHLLRRPARLLHVDTKKLGRIGRVGHRTTGDRRAREGGIGWAYVHVAIDDATRLAYVEVLRAKEGTQGAAFLWRALVWFRRLSIRVR